MSRDQIFNIIGIIGVISYVLPYVLLQLGKVVSESYFYSLTNLAGGLLLLISLSHSFNLPSFIANIVWVVFSIHGLIRLKLRRTPNPEEKDLEHA